MRANKTKSVWVLRGDLDSQLLSLESKTPHDLLNTKFIPDIYKGESKIELLGERKIE